MDLDPFSLRFFNDVRYEVSAIFVVQGCANLGIVDHLVEGLTCAEIGFLTIRPRQ